MAGAIDRQIEIGVVCGFPFSRKAGTALFAAVYPLIGSASRPRLLVIEQLLGAPSHSSHLCHCGRRDRTPAGFAPMRRIFVPATLHGVVLLKC
jgi:hypothetical protein